MPDIDFESLESVPVRPLPAAEVRRLGDRRRTRRRSAVAVGTTVAAVAAVAVLGATLAGGDHDRAVQPINSPSGSAPAPVVVPPSPSDAPSSSPTSQHSASPQTNVVDDGSAGAGAWGTDLLPTASDLIEYGATSTPWQAGDVRSGVPSSWLGPCRTGAPVRSGYVAAAWRDLTPQGDTIGSDAAAQAVLLDYPTEAAAQAAYQDLSDAFAGCAATIRADGHQVQTNRGPTEVDLGAFSSGPNAAEARSFMLAYPDNAAHAVTELEHGIAVDGSHLLVLTITQDTQDDWPDLQQSMPAVMERFGRTTGLPRTLTYPNQIDYVRLGESYDQAMAGGDLVQVSSGSISAWALRPYASTGADGSSANAGSVCVTPKQGVTAIWMPPQVTTAEGIGIGSTGAEVRQAYPDVTTESDGSLDHRLFGASDPKEFHFVLQGGTVASWSVTTGGAATSEASAIQHCWQ